MMFMFMSVFDTMLVIICLNFKETLMLMQRHMQLGGLPPRTSYGK